MNLYLVKYCYIKVKYRKEGKRKGEIIKEIVFKIFDCRLQYINIYWVVILRLYQQRSILYCFQYKFVLSDSSWEMYYFWISFKLYSLFIYRIIGVDVFIFIQKIANFFKIVCFGSF